MELRAGYKQTEVGVIPEDWRVVPLACLASAAKNAIVGGPFGSDLVSTDYVASGVPVVRGQNMGQAYISGDFVFVSKAKAKSLSANLARPGDLIFTQRGTLGQVSIVPSTPFSEYVVSQSQMKIALSSEVADRQYIFQYFCSTAGQKQIVESAIQTGVPHTNLGILKGYKVTLPASLEEQRTIATALSDVDALLAKIDQLIAKKRDLKQAAMQQLLTGQTRLPGFSGEWEVKRLGDLLKVRHGRSQHKVEREDGIYPILASGGEIGRTNNFLYNKPSVLIGRKGTIDKPKYQDTPFWTVDTLFYTELSGRVQPKFIYYQFLMVDWRSYNEASGVPSLNASTIEAVEILAPNLAEQTAIANLLSDMDAELAALEARRDKTRALKQGMMQALLTGRIRLVG